VLMRASRIALPLRQALAPPLVWTLMTSVDAPIIRVATAADLPALVESDPYAIAQSGRCVVLAAAIERGECFAAFVHDHVAGYTVLNYSFFGQGFVPLVVVSPGVRRQGIARLLFAAVESECKTESLFTSTNVSNIEAQRLFERVGFRPSGRIENLDPNDPELVYFKSRAARVEGSNGMHSSAAQRRLPLR
jgi:ribosomal protein S18 acetylase RimI-like enzyme